MRRSGGAGVSCLAMSRREGSEGVQCLIGVKCLVSRISGQKRSEVLQGGQKEKNNAVLCSITRSVTEKRPSKGIMNTNDA